MKTIMLSLILAGLALPVCAQTKTLLNLDKSGVAIQGYDPVAFFTDGKPVKGDLKFVSKRNGAIYFFASKEHKELFNAEPAKYEPGFGGYCAYGKGIRDDFNKDMNGNLAKANANWPGLVEKKGK